MYCFLSTGALKMKEAERLLQDLREDQERQSYIIQLHTPSMSYKKPSEKKLVAFLIFLQISYGFRFLEVKKRMVFRFLKIEKFSMVVFYFFTFF